MRSSRSRERIPLLAWQADASEPRFFKDSRRGQIIGLRPALSNCCSARLTGPVRPARLSRSSLQEPVCVPRRRVSSWYWIFKPPPVPRRTAPTSSSGRCERVGHRTPRPSPTGACSARLV